MLKRLTLTAVLAVLVACSGDPAAESAARLKRGDALLAQGKLPEAIVDYSAAVQANPNSAEARQKLGEVYAQTQDIRQAAEHLVRAADILNTDVKAQLRAGQVLLLARRFADAQGRADKVLALEPRNAEAHILKGNALGGLREFESALAELQRAVDVDPTSGEGFAHMGSVQYAKGDTELAEASFKRAISADPKFVNAHLALANLYWASNRIADAEKAINAALAIEPGNLLANRFQAALFSGTNRLKEAEKPLKAVAESGGGWQDKIALADYYVRTQRVNEARTVYQAVASDPLGGNTARLRLASLGLLEGNRAEAHRLIDEILARQPANAEALIGRAQLQFREGKSAEALASARAAVAASPSSSLAHFVLGRILKAQAQTDEAKAQFEAALSSHPNFVPAHMELGQLALIRGDAAGAVQHANAVLDQAPAYGEARLLLSRAYLTQGNVAAAEKALSVPQISSSNSPMVLAEIGRVRMAKGDRAGARQALTAALSKDPQLAAAAEAMVALDILENKRDAARALLDRIAADEKASAELLLVAAKSYASTFADRSAAERVIKRILSVEPNNPGAFDTLARLYVQAGDLAAATVEFERLAKLQPGSVGNQTAVGLLYHLQGKLDPAKAAYERALALDPQAPIAANNLAQLYVDQNENLEVALQLAKTAKAAMPNAHEVDDTLGWIYYKKGQAPSAIAPLKSAAAKDPKNPVYLYHLGAAQAALKQNVEARQSLEQALKLQPSFGGADDARKILNSLK